MSGDPIAHSKIFDGGHRSGKKISIFLWSNCNRVIQRRKLILVKTKTKMDSLFFDQYIWNTEQLLNEWEVLRSESISKRMFIQFWLVSDIQNPCDWVPGFKLSNSSSHSIADCLRSESKNWKEFKMDLNVNSTFEQTQNEYERNELAVNRVLIIIIIIIKAAELLKGAIHRDASAHPTQTTTYPIEISDLSVSSILFLFHWNTLTSILSSLFRWSGNSGVASVFYTLYSSIVAASRAIHMILRPFVTEKKIIIGAHMVAKRKTDSVFIIKSWPHFSQTTFPTSKL